MKSDFSNLKLKGIFPISTEIGWLTYVPLADSCFMADEQDLLEIDAMIKTGSLKGSKYDEVITPLIDESLNHCFPDSSVSKLSNMSIFPTWNCNFSCAYCYASQAHVKASMPLDIAFAAIDYFFMSGKGDISLQLLGGGEPFIEWDIVEKISSYARKRELLTGRKLTLSIATNGSILTEKIIRDILRYDIRISFSFEILEDIQDKQRGAYKKVHENLKRLIEVGMGDRIFLRTVITPLSVCRMEEMVDKVLRAYPSVCGVIAEPVMGNGNFASVDEYMNFCTLFYDNFSKARTKALQKGLNFTSMILRNMDFSIDKSCEGDFCVTPDGNISICHRLASPKSNAGKSHYCYGQIKDGMVHIDEDSYRKLVGPSINEREECKYCFAKFNCGGGCIARNLNETPQSKKAFCLLTQSLLKDELIRRYKFAVL